MSKLITPQEFITGNLITMLRVNQDFFSRAFRVRLSDIMFSLSVNITQCVQQSGV